MTLKGKTFTTYQIAEICDVYPTTVIGWIKRRELSAFTTPGGHRRVLHHDLLDFLRRFNIPLPDDLRQERPYVLVVEDDKTVGALLCRALRRALPDADVRWTQDGVGALLAIGKQAPQLLVVDVVMPVIDGARVLATLRHDESTRHIPVIGVTGKRLPPAKLAYMRRQTDAFFLKPFDLESFVARAASLIKTPRKG